MPSPKLDGGENKRVASHIYRPRDPGRKHRARNYRRVNMKRVRYTESAYKKRAEAVEVITRLILLERELHEEENEPCT